ncbi:MAG: OmpH family outer membrane protein [Bacteroidaceae bacterium]|nr:OmpH family outer membrane protein [Bacteroidaceae bacterium]
MNFKSASSLVLSAVAVLGFSQCKQQTSAPVQEQAPVAVSGLKIAYIDVDSLLANYAFYQDLSEEMLRKEENYRLVLAEDANKFQKDVTDFNKKIENGVYSSRERAEAEQNRLAKRQQALQEKSDKYSKELADEGNANAQKVSETIDNFIKEYNKSHGYDLIISKSSLMFANESLNITAEILEGLNAAYKPGK